MKKQKENHQAKEKVQHKQHDGTYTNTDNNDYHEPTKEGQKENVNS